MIFSILLLAILCAFNFINPACSDIIEDSACTTADCLWRPGTCRAVLCSLPDCAAGCDYVAAVPAECVDGDAITCAAIADPGDCVANEKCGMSDGTCSVSADAEVRCNVPANPDSETVCPDGCEVEQTPICEPRDIPITCEDHNTIPLTFCTMKNNCKWETSGGGKCVSQYGENDDCNDYNNSVVSDCLYSGICKVSGSSCVFDSNSRMHEYCNEIGVTDCDLEDQCKVESGVCVPALDEVCGSYSNSCLVMGFCKFSDDECVFDERACDSLSIEASTECTPPWRREACKVVEINDEVKQCQRKTAAEYCSTLSVVKYSPCEQDGRCHIDGGECVQDEDDNWDGCGSLDVGMTSSECTDSYYFNCEISEIGTCVPHISHCYLDATETHCDSNNAPADKCETQYQFTCINADCSSGQNVDSCSTITHNGYSAGCEWSEVGTCMTDNLLSCQITESDTCSPSGCTLMTGSDAECRPSSTQTDQTCSLLENTACGQTLGCAWFSSGGACVEKSCSNSPSYTLCCNGDPSCAYCTTGTRPNDCASATCANSPSYALCCNGDASCAYCTTGTRPSDCPNLDSAYHLIAPNLLVLAMLFIWVF